MSGSRILQADSINHVFKYEFKKHKSMVLLLCVQNGDGYI